MLWPGTWRAWLRASEYVADLPPEAQRDVPLCGIIILVIIMGRCPMLHVQLIAITRYLEDDGKPERLIARAGRVCYKSTKQGDLDKFIQARIREGHNSILEHASLTFEISGISRACLAQLTRHRIASFSVESQRRVNAEDAAFVIPPSIASNPSALKIFTDATNASTAA